MSVNSMNPEQYVDLFGGGATAKPKTGFLAGGAGGVVDIFNSSSTTDTTTTTSASTTDTTTAVSSSTTDTTTTVSSSSTTDSTTIADIFGADPEKGKGGRKPKYDFSDIKGYFEDRIKTGKFVKIEDVNEAGEPVTFVPSTPEEFDEVIQLQVEHRVGEQKKSIMQQVYQSKSPAWQAVLKYSELVDDPSEVVPFIQGVRTMESVANVDENTAEGAEKVVRARLLQKGDTPELVEQQVDTLKAADKLVSTAKVYKPMIIQQEQAALQQMMHERQQEEQQYLKMVETIEKSAVKAIEAPMFGKHKLTKDEKALVYDMIAYPSEQQGGYQIFNAIDELYKKNDFETLKLISLIAGGKKEAIINYIAAGASDKTAEGIQRKLRVAGTSSASSNNDNFPDDAPPVVRRTKFSGQFGRG